MGIRPTKEQIRYKHLRALLSEVMESLFPYNDPAYYDYVMRLDNIVRDNPVRKKGGYHKGDDKGVSLKRVYKLVGDIAE